MSDTIKKWHEMQEDKSSSIFESPDRGETVTERPFGGDISERVIIKQPVSKIKKEAYRLLCEYDEEVVRMAIKILEVTQ
tara:strand:+ start:219 stop:455 length:237 start_codon:yes stop_codon:yes gene_type:complete